MKTLWPPFGLAGSLPDTANLMYRRRQDAAQIPGRHGGVHQPKAKQRVAQPGAYAANREASAP